MFVGFFWSRKCSLHVWFSMVAHEILSKTALSSWGRILPESLLRRSLRSFWFLFLPELADSVATDKATSLPSSKGDADTHGGGGGGQPLWAGPSIGQCLLSPCPSPSSSLRKLVLHCVWRRVPYVVDSSLTLTFPPLSILGIEKQNIKEEKIGGRIKEMILLLHTIHAQKKHS